MKRIAFLAILLTYGCGGGADLNSDYVDSEITIVEGEVEAKRAEIAVQDEALAVIAEDRRELDAAPESGEKTDELTEMSLRETEVLDMKQTLESELDALMQRQDELGLERDRIQAEIEAQRQAEEARVLAEAEAESQRMAEEEAAVKAEEDARLAAEDETRRQAESEAQRQADEEARVKAEEEARLRADEETRRKAEEEALLKTEDAARIKAEKDAARSARQEIVDRLGEAHRQVINGSKSFGEVVRSMGRLPEDNESLRALLQKSQEAATSFESAQSTYTSLRDGAPDPSEIDRKLSQLGNLLRNLRSFDDRIRAKIK